MYDSWESSPADVNNPCRRPIGTLFHECNVSRCHVGRLAARPYRCNPGGCAGGRAGGYILGVEACPRLRTSGEHTQHDGERAGRPPLTSAASTAAPLFTSDTRLCFYPPALLKICLTTQVYCPAGVSPSVGVLFPRVYSHACLCRFLGRRRVLEIFLELGHSLFPPRLVSATRVCLSGLCYPSLLLLSVLPLG